MIIFLAEHESGISFGMTSNCTMSVHKIAFYFCLLLDEILSATVRSIVRFGNVLSRTFDGF